MSTDTINVALAMEDVAPRDNNDRPSGEPATLEVQPTPLAPANPTVTTPAAPPRDTGAGPSILAPPGFNTRIFQRSVVRELPVIETIRRQASLPQPSLTLGGEQGIVGTTPVGEALGPRNGAGLGGELRSPLPLFTPMTSVMDRIRNAGLANTQSTEAERIRAERGKQVAYTPQEQHLRSQTPRVLHSQPRVSFPDRSFLMSPPVMRAYERFVADFNSSPTIDLTHEMYITDEQAQRWSTELLSYVDEFRGAYRTVSNPLQTDYDLMMEVISVTDRQIAFIRQQRQTSPSGGATLTLGIARERSEEVPRPSVQLSLPPPTVTQPLNTSLTGNQIITTQHMIVAGTEHQSPLVEVSTALGGGRGRSEQVTPLPAQVPSPPPAVTIPMQLAPPTVLPVQATTPLVVAPIQQGPVASTSVNIIAQIDQPREPREGVMSEQSGESQSVTIGDPSYVTAYAAGAPVRLYTYHNSPTNCPLYIQILPKSRVRAVASALQKETRKFHTRPSAPSLELYTPLVLWVVNKLDIKHDRNHARLVAEELLSTTVVTPSREAEGIKGYRRVWRSMPVGTYETDRHTAVMQCATLLQASDSMKFVALVLTMMLQITYWTARQSTDVREEIRDDLATIIQAIYQHTVYQSGKYTSCPAGAPIGPIVELPQTPAVPQPPTPSLDLGLLNRVLANTPVATLPLASPSQRPMATPRGDAAQVRTLEAHVPPRRHVGLGATPDTPHPQTDTLRFVRGGVIGNVSSTPVTSVPTGGTQIPPPLTYHAVGGDGTPIPTSHTSRSRSIEPDNWMPSTERLQLFPEGTLGVYTANTAAPKQWPDFAYYFGYQQQPRPVPDYTGKLVAAPPLPIESYTRMPNIVTNVSLRAMSWKPHEKLTTSKRFSEWYNTTLTEKLLELPGTARFPDQLFLRIISGLSSDLRLLLTTYVTKAPMDVHLYDAMLWECMCTKQGALEWLKFVLRAVCARDTDKELEHASLITHNIRSENDGSTLEFCVNKLIWAVSVMKARGIVPDYRMLVQRMVRVFGPVEAHDFNKLIQIRHLTLPTTRGLSHVQTFEYLNDTMDQGDMLPNTHAPDWSSRWESITLQARQLCERARTLIEQRLPDEALFPTYIQAVVEIHDPHGYAQPGGYPRPSWARGRASQLASRSSYYDRPRSRSIDRYAPSTYIEDRSRSRRYDDRDRSRSRSRDRTTFRSAPRREYSRERVTFDTPTQHGNHTSTHPPPSFRDQIGWFQARKCVACGASPSDHTSWKTCPIRTKHFPQWSPDLSSLASQAPSQALAACEVIDLNSPAYQLDLNTTGAQPQPSPMNLEQAARQQTNLGSKYAHRNDNNVRPNYNRDRSRSRERDFSRGQSRDRHGSGGDNRSRDRGRSRERDGSWQRNDGRRDNHSQSRDRNRSASRDRIPHQGGGSGHDRQRDRSRSRDTRDRSRSRDTRQPQAPYQHQPSNDKASA